MAYETLQRLSEAEVAEWFRNGDLKPYSPEQDSILRQHIRKLVERKCGCSCPQVDDICQEMLLRLRSGLRSVQLIRGESSVAKLGRIIQYHIGPAISIELSKSGKPMKRNFGVVVSETKLKLLSSQTGSRVKVKEVLSGSAADSAGIRQHDIIDEVDGAKITSKKDLERAIRPRLNKTRYSLTLIRGEERIHAALASTDRDHHYAYRETTMDGQENWCVEGMSEEEKFLSVLAARAALDRMKNTKAKRAFELRCLDGLTYSQMVDLDKNCFRNENYCSVLVGRGFKEAGMNLERYATEMLKCGASSLTKELRAIYRRIQEDAREIVKRFQQY